MVMAYGYYKLFYGIREQQYVPQFNSFCYPSIRRPLLSPPEI